MKNRRMKSQRMTRIRLYHRHRLDSLVRAVRCSVVNCRVLTSALPLP